MEDKIKWGVIGLGNIARKFAHDLEMSKDGYLYAIASRSQEGIDSFGKEFSAAKKYTDYQKLLDDREVDVVYIATPHSHHYPWIMKCLESGKHVLCEKPLCVNADQVQEVINKQKQTGLFLMEALWTRFLPAYVHLLSEIKSSGDPILSISSDFCYSSNRGDKERIYNPGLAGGSLLDIGIYPLFLSLDLMGEPDIGHVTGYIEKGVDIRMSAILEYDQGRTAMVHSDVQSLSKMEAIIRMKDKVYVLPHRWHEMDFFHTITGENSIRHDFPKTGLGYFHEIEHVNKCLKDSIVESPVYTVDQSLRLARFMDRFRKKLNFQYPDEIEKK